MSNAVKTTQDLKNQLLSTYERDPFSVLPMKFSVSMPQEQCLKLRRFLSPWMFLMNVDVDVRQDVPAAEGNTSLDEDVNRVQDQYEASKVNVITCLPNGEERCLSFF